MKVLVRAPAKINTFLAVGPPDATGYHPVRTILQAVSLCDELIIESASEDGVTSSWSELPEKNTITDTLAALRRHVPLEPLRIHLDKKVPAESGLGGGSSDAAALLRAVDHFLPAPLGTDLKFEIARGIGVDCASFLVGGRALGQGYGEQLSPLSDPEPRWALVIARPPVGCSTPAMYRALNAKSYPWRELSNLDEVYNDFERVAPCECLDLIEGLQGLGAESAGLSGSGSAVFGRFATSGAAEDAGHRLRANGITAFVCRTLTREESLDPGTVIP